MAGNRRTNKARRHRPSDQHEDWFLKKRERDRRRKKIEKQSRKKNRRNK